MSKATKAHAITKQPMLQQRRERERKQKARKAAIEDLSSLMERMAVARDMAEDAEKDESQFEFQSDLGYFFRLQIIDFGTRIENACEALGIPVSRYFTGDPGADRQGGTP